jgi:hypothetical protein
VREDARICRESRVRASRGGQGHSSRAGIMEGDEHATFPPLPGDHHPSAGHPLPDLRPHPCIPAGQHQRGIDRALPPGSSRGARHPFPVTGSRLRPARIPPRTSAGARRTCGRSWPAGAPAFTRRDRCAGGGRAKSRRYGAPNSIVDWVQRCARSGRYGLRARGFAGLGDLALLLLRRGRQPASAQPSPDQLSFCNLGAGVAAARRDPYLPAQCDKRNGLVVHVLDRGPPVEQRAHDLFQAPGWGFLKLRLV